MCASVVEAQGTSSMTIDVDCCTGLYATGWFMLQAKERERAVEQERRALEQRVERLQKVVK